MYKSTLALSILLFSCSVAYSQSDSTSALTITIGQDSYFGFYVSGYGTYRWKENISVSIYNNYWANPAFGNITTGTDFWTEFGGGLDFTIAEVLHVNPMIGITYGKVLSGGEKGVIGDGIVPSLTLTMTKPRLSFSGSATWFKALRKEGPASTDYVWLWINVLHPISPKLHAGVLAEQFILSRMTGNERATLYCWLGPLLQFNFPKGSSLKISGGYDTINKEYFKANLIFPVSLQ